MLVCHEDQKARLNSECPYSYNQVDLRGTLTKS